MFRAFSARPYSEDGKVSMYRAGNGRMWGGPVSSTIFVIFTMFTKYFMVIHTK